jgi:hypothetical protein
MVDSNSPVPGTCVRLQASNSISDLYLINCGREHYYRQRILFDPVFGQKQRWPEDALMMYMPHGGDARITAPPAA